MDQTLYCTKTEAGKILGIGISNINFLIKNKSLTFVDNKYILIESVMAYKKEMEERRNMPKPVWVNRNEF
jgi:hypothetical protein